MGLVINLSLDDGFQFDDQAVINEINYTLLAETLDFLGAVNIPGQPYISLSLDTEKLFPSIHSYPFFTSFCEIAGVLYATSEDGIHKISGTTDNGAEFHTGMLFKTDFGITNIKKIRCIVFDGDVSGVQVKATSGGVSGTYGINQNRVYVGRDVIGKDWDLRIADFDRLDGFEVVPNIGRRR